jgi:hypothetical protein
MLDLKIAVAAFAVAGAMSAGASAAPFMLTIENLGVGGGTTIVADNGAFDRDMTVGVIDFSAGSAGLSPLYGFGLQVDLALSGSPVPSLSLNTSSKGAGGKISITASDGGYAAPDGDVQFVHGATLNSIASGAKSVYDGSVNGTPFAQMMLDTSPDSDRKFLTTGISGVFSMLTSIIIDHTSVTNVNGVTLANTTISQVPLPAAGLLLFGAIGGLGFVSRKRKGT